MKSALSCIFSRTMRTSLATICRSDYGRYNAPAEALSNAAGIESRKNITDTGVMRVKHTSSPVTNQEITVH